MPDEDRESPPVYEESSSPPRYKMFNYTVNWPVVPFDDYEYWPVVRAADETDELDLEDVEPEPVEEVEWIGFRETESGGEPYLYAADSDAVYRGELDRDNERIMLREERVDREVDSPESLGEHVEAIGEEHDWSWLSSFAREHLEDEDEPEDHYLPQGFEYVGSDFERRNVLDSADADLAFSASHTLSNEEGRVHVLERDFSVFADGETERESVRVEVDERYLVAEGTRAAERGGDAERVDEQSYDLAVDADTDGVAWENDVEDHLDTWHEAHLAPPVGGGDDETTR